MAAASTEQENPRSHCALFHVDLSFLKGSSRVRVETLSMSLCRATTRLTNSRQQIDRDRARVGAQMVEHVFSLRPGVLFLASRVSNNLKQKIRRMLNDR